LLIVKAANSGDFSANRKAAGPVSKVNITTHFSAAQEIL
jgi:hypothetical protein